MYVCISVCVHVGVCVSGENMLDMALWFTALSLTHTHALTLTWQIAHVFIDERKVFRNWLAYDNMLWDGMYDQGVLGVMCETQKNVRGIEYIEEVTEETICTTDTMHAGKRINQVSYYWLQVYPGHWMVLPLCSTINLCKGSESTFSYQARRNRHISYTTREEELRSKITHSLLLGKALRGIKHNDFAKNACLCLH